MATNNPPPVKATTTSFRVIDAIMDLDDPGLSELATHLDMAKSSMHNHLATLEELGYVIRDEEGTRVGLKFFQLGVDVRSRRTLYALARSEIDRLAAVSGLDAGIVVEENGTGVCLYSQLGTDGNTPVVEEGDVLPLHATAAGKAILAAQPRDDVQGMIDDHGLSQFTSHTITDSEELWSELQTIQSRGIAQERQEHSEEVSGIGGAITDVQGQVLGAIFVAGMSSDLSGKELRQNNPGLIISAKNRIANPTQPPTTE